MACPEVMEACPACNLFLPFKPREPFMGEIKGYRFVCQDPLIRGSHCHRELSKVGLWQADGVRLAIL